MMRSDALNLHGYPVRTEMTALTSQVFSTEEDKSKGIIVHKTLSQSCSREEEESKGIIVNKTLSQSCSTDKDELCSTEKDKLECAINKKKTQITRLHMMCLTILTPLTYSNAEERFWTDLACHMK